MGPRGCQLRCRGLHRGVRCDRKTGYLEAVKVSRLAWLLTGFSLSLPVACDPGDDADTVSREDLKREELDARCEYLARCGFYPDAETCRDVTRPDPQLVQAIGSSVFGRVDIDDEAAAVWVETLRGLSCEATAEVFAELEEARAAVFVGGVEEGGECFSDYECAEGNVCDRDLCQGGGGGICCVGFCTRYRILAEGDDCPLSTGDGTSLFAACDAATTYCAAPEVEEGGEPPTEGTCTLRVDNGMACTSDAACADGQRCNIENGEGACFKLSAHGEMCNPTLSSGSCLDINDVCDPDSSTCRLAPAPGEACPAGRCAGWARCEDDDGDPETPGSCLAFAQRGEACDDNPCLGDLVCREGLCEDLTTELVCLEGDPPPPPME